MDANSSVGARIKSIRKDKNLTLKQISEKTGLSIGFLSQLERGVSTIAIDSLAKIAEVFEMKLSDFFQDIETQNMDPVVHSYELRSSQINPQIIQFLLCHKVDEFNLLPRIYQLLPQMDVDSDHLEMYSHTGEEFIYVLEGIVHLYVDAQKHCLYPGDSILVHSNSSHNWINPTNRVTRLLTINYPNPFKDSDTNAIP